MTKPYFKEPEKFDKIEKKVTISYFIIGAVFVIGLYKGHFMTSIGMGIILAMTHNYLLYLRLRQHQNIQYREIVATLNENNKKHHKNYDKIENMLNSLYGKYKRVK